MQDLSMKVQDIASSFFQDHKNLTKFNLFYETMLPEANKMLRTYVQDRATITEITSKIFENILIKPPIFLTPKLEQEFIDIANLYYGTNSEVIHRKSQRADAGHIKDGRHWPQPVTKVTYAPCGKMLVKKDEKIPVEDSKELTKVEIGKLWVLLHRPDEYQVVVKGRVMKVVEFLRCKEDDLVCDDIIDLLDRHKELLLNGTTKLNFFDYLRKRLTDQQIQTILLKIDIKNQLNLCPSTFVYDPDKLFLHYFSRIIKTNALSLLKKNNKYQEISESEQYGNFDEDDRSQLINNQLSDEPIKTEEEQAEFKRKLSEQQRMMIYDVIQNHYYHESDTELRLAMVRAILLGWDYNKICEGFNWKIEHGKNAGKGSATGKIKSRVHRFKKKLHAEISSAPQFTKSASINLDLYHTYFESGQIHTVVEICETELDGGGFHTTWHGHYIKYYSTGQIKEAGRYYLGERQGLWYEYYKTGEVMKRGKYCKGKMIGNWHHFGIDGEVQKTLRYEDGLETYYEVRTRIDKWHCNIVAGNPGNPFISKLKKSDDEISSEKLCLKYDDEFSYSPIHLEISQAN